MDEHRQVAVGEGRLLVGDRIECDAGLSDDALAILARDLTMQIGAIGFEPLGGHTMGRTADLALRFKIDALIGEAAVVDPRVDIEFASRAFT